MKSTARCFATHESQSNTAVFANAYHSFFHLLTAKKRRKTCMSSLFGTAKNLANLHLKEKWFLLNGVNAVLNMPVRNTAVCLVLPKVRLQRTQKWRSQC